MFADTSHGATEITRTPLLGLIRDRLGWLGQRQRVLAENLANADTPGFRPRDLVPFAERLSTVVREPAAPLTATDKRHLAVEGGAAAEARSRRQRTVYETTPSGNAVVLEEQMAKVHDTATTHRLATQLYRKYLGLVRIAVSSKS
jgi:flagellar basal-body rod protein FlgB